MKYIILFIISILVIIVIYYNIMLKKENKIKNALATLDVMYKKRIDLIPNLVNVIKGYMFHEKDILKNITSLRNNSSNEEIDNKIQELLILSENYPNLKANENFLSLQDKLKVIEDEISAGRRTYNAHVVNYNIFISMIPNVFFAKLLHFKKYELFKIDNDKKDISYEK